MSMVGGTAGVVGRDGAGGQASDAAGVGEAADLCGLDGEGLPHDGAAVGQALKSGHGASARGRRGLGSRTGRGGKGTQRGGGCLLHEGAHGLGLPENSVHVRGVNWYVLFKQAVVVLGVRSDVLVTRQGEG